MNLQVRLPILFLVALIATTGCRRSGPEMWSPNSGVDLQSQIDTPLRAGMFIGKWDLDARRTQIANGQGTQRGLATDTIKNVMGTGWFFKPAGHLDIDSIVGTRPGQWWTRGKNTLVIRETDSQVNHYYKAAFHRGYLYLRKPDGFYLVFERDKFLGF